MENGGLFKEWNPAVVLKFWTRVNKQLKLPITSKIIMLIIMLGKKTINKLKKNNHPYLTPTPIRKKQKVWAIIKELVKDSAQYNQSFKFKKRKLFGINKTKNHAEKE